MKNKKNGERLSCAIDVAKKAGKILMKHWGKNLKISYKKDEFDPVTIADRESDALIRREIMKLFPSDLILSEENDSIPKDYGGVVWMVDPLDDTKAFSKGLEPFSVSIACVKNGVPEIGVVFAPARKVIYYSIKGEGAFMKKNNKTKQIFGSNIKQLKMARIIKKLPGNDSRPLDEVLSKIKVKEFIEDGSICLAMSRVAAGDAECTICTNPRVSKWDSAAGQAILEEVGGIVSDTKGKPLDYKKEGVGWPDLVVASSNHSIHSEFIAALQ